MQTRWAGARHFAVGGRPVCKDEKANAKDDDIMPKSNSRRLDKDEKNVLLHLLQAPKLTNCDIARYVLSRQGLDRGPRGGMKHGVQLWVTQQLLAHWSYD